jgi:hypothetical protein
VLEPGNALKPTELELGVSVPPPLDELYKYVTVMVAVVAPEVRVTVSVYVWPLCIPAVRATEKYKIVGVVNTPVTLSQF